MLETTIKINERDRQLATTTIESMLKAIDDLKSDGAVEARYDLKLLLNKFNKTSMENTTKECPYCGEEILIKAIKCKHCGEKLTLGGYIEEDKEETKSFRLSKEKSKNNGIIWFLAIGGLFFFPLWIVLAVVLIIRAINKSKTNQSNN